MAVHEVHAWRQRIHARLCRPCAQEPRRQHRKDEVQGASLDVVQTRFDVNSLARIAVNKIIKRVAQTVCSRSVFTVSVTVKQPVSGTTHRTAYEPRVISIVRGQVRTM